MSAELQIIDLKVGEGKEAVKGALITTHYTGSNGGSGGGSGANTSRTYGVAGCSNGGNGSAGTQAGGTGQGTTTYEFGDSSLTLYAGGGGSGAFGGSGGAGGSGGGGNGASGYSTAGGTASPNTGGGGGGAIRFRPGIVLVKKFHVINPGGQYETKNTPPQVVRVLLRHPQLRGGRSHRRIPLSQAEGERPVGPVGIKLPWYLYWVRDASRSRTRQGNFARAV